MSFFIKLEGSQYLAEYGLVNSKMNKIGIRD